MNDLFFIVLHFAARASAMVLLFFFTIDDLTCELVEILYLLTQEPLLAQYPCSVCRG